MRMQVGPIVMDSEGIAVDAQQLVASRAQPVVRVGPQGGVRYRLGPIALPTWSASSYNAVAALALSAGLALAVAAVAGAPSWSAAWLPIPGLVAGAFVALNAARRIQRRDPRIIVFSEQTRMDARRVMIALEPFPDGATVAELQRATSLSEDAAVLALHALVASGRVEEAFAAADGAWRYVRAQASTGAQNRASLPVAKRVNRDHASDLD